MFIHLVPHRPKGKYLVYHVVLSDKFVHALAVGIFCETWGTSVMTVCYLDLFLLLFLGGELFVRSEDWREWNIGHSLKDYLRCLWIRDTAFNIFHIVNHLPTIPRGVALLFDLHLSLLTLALFPVSVTPNTPHPHPYCMFLLVLSPLIRGARGSHTKPGKDYDDSFDACPSLSPSTFL